MQKDDIAVSFDIYDFNFSFSNLSELVKLPNSSLTKKGEVKLSGPSDRPARITATQNMWSLSSDLDRSVNVEMHIDRLLHILMPHKQLIEKLATESNIMFRCTLLLQDSQPGINLSNEQLWHVTELGASIDLDVYFLGG